MTDPQKYEKCTVKAKKKLPPAKNLACHVPIFL